MNTCLDVTGKKMRRCTNGGFTLVELMIVVAIIGILASIAFPQFAYMVAKAQEGTTKANLGALRSALSLYYSDNEGMNTSNAAADLAAGGRYISSIPYAYYPTTPKSPGHSPSNRIFQVGVDLNTPLLLIEIEDYPGIGGGGFVYDASGTPAISSYSPATPTAGQIVCLCAHTDLRGTSWATY